MFCLIKWDFGSFFHTNKGLNFFNFIQSALWISGITKQLVDNVMFFCNVVSRWAILSEC